MTEIGFAALHLPSASPVQEPSPAGVRVIPAATLVIFRRTPHLALAGPPEVLMVQRSHEMRFAGGAAVFPGGRVDPADRDLAEGLLAEAQARGAAVGDETERTARLDDLAARVAAIRETLEETGLALGLDRPASADQARQARDLLASEGALAPVLARMGWSLRLDALTAFTRWCPAWDGAFDTRFFLADLGTGAVDLAVDATENSRLFWTSAAEALAMAEREEISVIFPTRRNLERLALFASFAEARDQALAIPPRLITPARVERDGQTWLTIPPGLGYPVTAQPMSTVKRG